MDTLLGIYIAGGLILTALSLPLIWEKIKPNGLYGFRVSQTLDNPEVWYKTNKYAGKRLFISGVTIICAAIVLYLMPGISIDTYALACLAIFSVVFIAGLIQCLAYMKA